MATDPMALLRLLTPQIPTLASTAFWHTLGRSPTSSKWDLRTELTITIFRKLMIPAKPSPISRVQGFTLKDPGVKGKMWIAKTTMAAPNQPGDDLAKIVCETVDSMATGPINYTRPDAVDLEVEWTGYRPGAKPNDPLPDISEAEKYKRLMDEPSRTSNTTILYFHGGAYYLCDPATHREVCSRLAHEAHGRVCNVRYRLAPQSAFPSQLIDALQTYLTLLYPPPGSMHTAVPAEHIVLSGDSAGGNMAMALLQLILQLHRTNRATCTFHGRSVAIPLPAGVAANSGWFDIARSLPSLLTNAQYDYLPVPNDLVHTRWPTDSIWPTKPPRGDLYCDLSVFDHPLASVVLASSSATSDCDGWKSSPPLWLCSGEEMLSDEIAVVAKSAAESGVTVQYEVFEAMPHVFNQMLLHLSAAQQSMKNWGEFCRKCVDEPASLVTKGTFYSAKTLKERKIDVVNATELTVADARRYVTDAKRRRVEGYESETKSMPQPSL